MAQHGRDHGGDVVVGDVIALVRERAGLGGEHDELRRADAGAVVDVFLDEVRCAFTLGPRGTHQADDIARECFGDGHHAHELLEVEQIFG